MDYIILFRNYYIIVLFFIAGLLYLIDGIIQNDNEFILGGILTMSFALYKLLILLFKGENKVQIYTKH